MSAGFKYAFFGCKISAPEGCFVKLFHIHRLQYLRQPDKTEWVDIRERQPPPLHISLLEGMPHGMPGCGKTSAGKQEIPARHTGRHVHPSLGSMQRMSAEGRVGGDGLLLPLRCSFDFPKVEAERFFVILFARFRRKA